MGLSLTALGMTDVRPEPLSRVIFCGAIPDAAGWQSASQSVRDAMEYACDSATGSCFTGVMVIDGRGFAQVLEGPSGAIRDVYSHVSLGRWHDGVVLLEAETVAEREFSAWSIACFGLVEPYGRQKASSGALAVNRLASERGRTILAMLCYVAAGLRSGCAGRVPAATG